MSGVVWDRADVTNPHALLPNPGVEVPQRSRFGGVSRFKSIAERVWARSQVGHGGQFILLQDSCPEFTDRDVSCPPGSWAS